MSQGPIDPIRKMVSERITQKMYGPKNRYVNERGNFLHGLLQDDIVNLVKDAIDESHKFEGCYSEVVDEGPR